MFPVVPCRGPDGRRSARVRPPDRCHPVHLGRRPLSGPLSGMSVERVGPAVVLGISIALIVFSVLLMLLVLMHKGKGGGLSDMFGGGMQSSVGGSSVAERNLDRMTVIVGLVWFGLIVALGIVMK